MNLPTFINKWIISNRYLRYRPIWWWYRLMSHQGFRFDDYHIWGEFWHSLNSEWEHMEFVYKFEKFWGKGSYPPEKILISSEDYDKLQEMIAEPPKPIPGLIDLMNRKSPFEND